MKPQQDNVVPVQELSSVLTGSVSENTPLAPFSTFRIGGVAKMFVEPRTIADIIAIHNFSARYQLPLFILGNGSNILISDEGWPGIVINLETGFNTLQYDDGIVTAGAGVKMATFVDFAIRHQRKGVEMLAGIPATIGGALWMNAGCYGGETSDYLLDVTLVRDQQPVTLSKAECNFKYRHSGFQRSDVIVGARFKMDEGKTDELQEIKLGHVKHRNGVQPVSLPNCGSVFKNPKPQFSAELIEAAGLKGAQIGGAQISPKHANFIVNIAHAKAQDVIDLINLARQKVFEATGIILEPEVQFIGFTQDPIRPIP